MTKSKPVEPPKLATWLLGKLLPESGPMTGDLIEAFKQGRSSGWYWRQVIVAILIALPQLMREYLAPFAFAAACSAVISTAWFFMFPSAARESAFPRLFALYAKGYGIEWPWSFVYQVAFISLFQSAAVWAALIAYLTVSHQRARRNVFRAFPVVLVVLAISNLALPLVSGLLNGFQWFGWVVVSAPPGIAFIVGNWRARRSSGRMIAADGTGTGRDASTAQ